MTITEAKRICRKFHHLTNPMDEDFFRYTEALGFLIEKTKDSDYMVELGAMYYEQRQFDLALKYYEMAAEYDNLYAISNLGYVWYYGRTGEKNYEKAFYYFDRARKMGDLIAAYKVADMYKNGYYVEKDVEKYKAILLELYPKVRAEWGYTGPAPEVLTRLAAICVEEGETEGALELYDDARWILSERIGRHPFFGDLSIMKWLINDTYKLRRFDPENVSLYDLYYLLKQPVKVSFLFEKEMHEAEAVEKDGEVAIRLDDRWYHTVEDFFEKAELDGELLTMRYAELHDFRVVSK